MNRTASLPLPRGSLRSALCLALLAASLESCRKNHHKANLAPGNGAGVTAADHLFVAVNPRHPQTIVKLDDALEIQEFFSPGGNGPIDLDLSSSLYRGNSLDPTVPAGVRVYCNVHLRLRNEPYREQVDRTIGGPGTTRTGLVEPEGLVLAHRLGLVIVSDHGASQLVVLGSAAEGDAPPVATTPLEVPPWDLEYDEIADRLFVASTEGSVLVFDDYLLGGFGAAGPSRVLFPVDGAGDPLAQDVRGLAYDRTSDLLIVSDVGAVGDLDDGRVFVLSRASTRSGGVAPVRTIAGPSTQLGDPVDVDLDGDDGLLVVDRARELVLFFDGFLLGTTGDLAPQRQVALTFPDSVTHQFDEELAPLGSDLDLDPTTVVEAVAVAGGSPHESVRRFTPELDHLFGVFDAGTTIHGLVFGREGDAFASFEDGADAGVLVFGRASRLRDGDSFDPSRDRVLTGPLSGLHTPRGLELTDIGMLLVADADPSDPAIVAFSHCTGPASTPILRVTELDGGVPYDLDYQDSADRLFVSTTDGRVLVYDQFVSTQGAGGPDRILSPTGFGGGAPLEGLRGIVYVESEDALILTGVGAPSVSGDGTLSVLRNAAAANGNVEAQVVIHGATSLLDDPVDVVFDGHDAYVAEELGNVVLRFDSLLLQVGDLDVGPDASRSMPSPSSVALVVDRLSATPR